MTNQEFGAALAALINKAFQDGMDPYHIVGLLELAKLDLVRNMQDIVKAQQAGIIKVNRPLPPSLS